MKPRLPLALGVAAWAVALGAGMAWAQQHAARPGEPAAAPLRWPSQSRLARGPGPQLIVFAHPECPCSRASLRELERLLGSNPGRRAAVVFASSGAAPVAGSPLWAQASAIAGVTAIDDRGGVEARLFGAATSGTALLFDEAGALRFRGGLTQSRGHEGDTPGKAALAALLGGLPAPTAGTPVFGCSLF